MVVRKTRRRKGGRRARVRAGGGALQAYCAKIYADPACAGECNWLVWTVAEAFCGAGSHGFGASKDGSSADRMVDVMSAGNGWTAVTDSDPDATRRAGNIVDAAIRLAAEGKLVIAGMKSTWFAPAQAHGHVAVVIGAPGEYSATAKHVLPCGYAGSRKASARIPMGEHRHLGWSFPAAEWKAIGYWYRAPDRGRSRQAAAANT